MNSFEAAGDKSAERSQLPTGRLKVAPILTRVQSTLPALMAAEDAITRAILESQSALSSFEKLGLLWAAGTRWPANISKVAIPTGPDHGCDQSLLLSRFGLKLAQYGPWCSKHHCDELVAAGYTEDAIVAAVATVALGHFRCTLVAGLLQWNSAAAEPIAREGNENLPEWSDNSSPFVVPPVSMSSALESPFGQMRGLFGFVPNLVRIQAWLPDLVAAEIKLMDTVLSPEDGLSQIQKHRIMLSLAAANCNNYLVALHGEILNLIGSDSQESMAILDDPETAPIPAADRALCREARKLRILPYETQQPIDQESLAAAGWTEEHITEAVVTAALANFLSTMQFGMGAVPDFPPLRTFCVKDLYLSAVETRPTHQGPVREDPDLELVSKVKEGETDAFEGLVRAHTRRVFRTLYGLLGNPEEARDATQDTFLKAFENIEKFEGRSKFSTWLTSIAVNTGTEALRRRRPLESLDSEDDEHGFRPRQVRSWVDNPEQALAKSQMNDLVRNGVLRLPEKYRTALLLRDINQLSTEDTAEALGLSVSATKARILRGRLMLRESLAPHFSEAEGDRHV